MNLIQNFYLCRFIGNHHLVSWLRVKDMSVLTVGGLVFSSDPRISVTVTPDQVEIINIVNCEFIIISNV